jgi:hypothetical protein
MKPIGHERTKPSMPVRLARARLGSRSLRHFQKTARQKPREKCQPQRMFVAIRRKA